MPTIDRAEPPYLQVVRHIRDRITSGELKDGDMIPSARQIAREWDVSLATATKALSTLRTSGLVRGVKGVGTVVHTEGQAHQTARDRTVSINRTGKIYPPGHYAKIRSAQLVSASKRAAEALGIEEGAPAIRRQRTTYREDHSPISTSVSWFAGDLAAVAPLLLTTGRIVQGTTQYVEEQTGRGIVATYVEHAAGAASDDAAGELGVPEGSPVLLSRNRFIDGDGAVIEYGESTAQPDHWIFYEYSIEDGE
ncbi:GntR family transcriptional regulator [Saccharopolyspora gregorii]|uniref:GntR family transcriptional regulator n=1 Tax=Saccharopolyspora gregorii TaxID=33914 RepID=A0ABP6RPC7_9PSEU